MGARPPRLWCHSGRKAAIAIVAVGPCLTTITAIPAAQSLGETVLQKLGNVQADEIFLDPNDNRLVIRGNVRMPGAESSGDEIVCDLNSGALIVTNRIQRTDDRYGVGAATCNALIDIFRRDGRLR